MEDAEAKPVEVIVHGRQVVHVEDHRRAAAAAAFLGLHVRRRWNPLGATDLSTGTALAPGLVLVEFGVERSGERFLFRFDLIQREERKGKSS